MSNSCEPKTARLLCTRDFPGKNTAVSYHFLLQGIFLTQGLNPGTVHFRQSPALQADSLQAEPPGKLYNITAHITLVSGLVRGWDGCGSEACY